MTPVMARAALGAMISFALTMPVLGQNEVRPAKKKSDPNEVVCEKQEVLGSRLAVRRVCRTRSEWAEQRQVDRDLVNRTQLGSCMKKSGC